MNAVLQDWVKSRGRRRRVPLGGRYAGAVFTRTARTSALLPAAEAVIGTAARLAVDALRAP